jgi:RimJ/RimL family protein N-acetyltransferase
MTHADAVTVSNWHYEGPWAIYDFNGRVLDVIDDYYTLSDPTSEGDPIGFFWVRYEASIPGLDEAAGTVDLGCGMNPAWVGRGHGNSFGATVLAQARRIHRDTSRFRALVQSWNQRCIAVLRKLGFTPAGIHVCDQQGVLVQYDVFILK